MDKAPVVDQASRSVKWAALGALLPKLVTPVVTLVLAALLTPADFGIVAAAMAVVSFGQIVVEMGMGAAVVQRRTQVFEAASLALLFSATVGLALYAILWIAAPAIAGAYDIDELQSALRVVGVSLVLSALISVPTALLTRELQFRRLFWIGALPQITNALVSLAMALAGGGYWALIGGYLSGRVLNLVLVWRAGRWRPKPVFDRQLFRSLFVFSAWVFVSGLQSWLFLYADNLLAGYFFGASFLGVYALGFNLAMLLPGMLIAPLVSIAYPAFSAIQVSQQEVGRSLLKLQRLAASLLMPVALGTSAIAIPLIGLLYGDRWPGLGYVIQVTAIGTIGQIWSLNVAAFRAIGRPDMWPKIAFVALPVLYVLLFIAAPHGMVAFVWARLIGGLILPIGNIIVGSRLFSTPLLLQWKALRVPAICSFVMFVLASLSSQCLAPFVGLTGWVKLAFLVSISSLMYVGLVVWLERPLWNEMVVAARRSILPQKEQPQPGATR